jgi:hypothetical protein
MIREDVYTRITFVEVIPLEVLVQVFLTFKHGNDLITMRDVF